MCMLGRVRRRRLREGRYLAANDMTESVDAFLEKLVEVNGNKGGYEYIQPANCEPLFYFILSLKSGLLMSLSVQWMKKHLELRL